MFACGLNDCGQLGQPASIPFASEAMLVPLDVEVTHVAAGNNHTLCVDVDGGVWAFGKNDSGQLGTGRQGDFFPQKIDSLVGEARITQVACGAEHSLALSSSGQVYSWGSSVDGVLGHGSETWNKSWFYRTAKTEMTPRLIRSLREKNSVNGYGGPRAFSVCGRPGNFIYVGSRALQSTWTRNQVYRS